MKSKIFSRMKPVLMVMTFLLFMACQSEEESWNKIKASDKPSDIEAFINDFPNGKYLKEAQGHLLILKKSIALKEAQTLNTIEAYESYLKSFPDSSAQQTEMNKVLYQLRGVKAFAEAKKANTIEAYENYLKTYSDSSQQSTEVSKVLYQLKAEKAFTEAEKANTSESLESFINTYPESIDIERAKTILGKIEGRFIGVCYVDIIFKNGSYREADTKMVLTFQDNISCKKYEMRIAPNFSIGSDPSACIVIGYKKGNIIFVKSLNKNLEESMRSSILEKYNANCKSKLGKPK